MKHIDESDVANIKRLLARGYSVHRASDASGISRATIAKIRDGKYEPWRPVVHEPVLKVDRIRQLACLARDSRLNGYRQAVGRRPFNGNLFTSLRFTPTGILWEELREKLGLPTVEELRNGRRREAYV